MANIKISELPEISSFTDTCVFPAVDGSDTTKKATGSKLWAWIKAKILGDIPAGVIYIYAGSTAPTGWLLCRGASLLRTDYPALFTAIGTTYGSADSTHFNLPDFREAAPVGINTRILVTGQAASNTPATHDSFTRGQFKDDCLQGHSHDYADFRRTYAAASGSAAYVATSYDTIPTQAIQPLDDYGTPRIAAVTRGKRLGVNFIIKY